MKLLHYVEIENFKGFGERQRIELDHPAVLIGPNNCGKTTVIQAIALWSLAVKAWFAAKGESLPKKRSGAAVNRLEIVSVPVHSTRYFWHNTTVRIGRGNVAMALTVGFQHDGGVVPVTMNFRNHGDELVYCNPDEDTLGRLEVIEAAAKRNVKLLYPMSGVETEEAILQPGRIDVLLGQEQTAQVLRNLCLLVYKSSPGKWENIIKLMLRLFQVELGNPMETARGSIDLLYQQQGIKSPLDVSLAGRGLQQMLLLLSYLHSHPDSVILTDEPDAHLEILRQKQVYTLLKEIAQENGSQVIVATHSEVVLDEASDHNLTLLLDGKADNLAEKKHVRASLGLYGAEHYVRARQLGHVFYVEGRTDLEILKELAKLLKHPVVDFFDGRINTYYTRGTTSNVDSELDTALDILEEKPVRQPDEHFFKLSAMMEDLHGLAILDSDRHPRDDREKGHLKISFWKRYEIENYIVNPEVLRSFSAAQYKSSPSFEKCLSEAENILDDLVLKQVFDGMKKDMDSWKSAPADASGLIWEAKTERVKLSDFAEDFFRLLAGRLGHSMLLRKSGFHQLVDFLDAGSVPPEVRAKLDLLEKLFTNASPFA